MRRFAFAVALVVAGCGARGHGGAPHPAASTAVAPGQDGGVASTLTAIERAEDGRGESDLDEAWLTSPVLAVRRRAARALSRVVEPPVSASGDKALLRALGDEDREVAAWGAYGLGWACKGKEDVHVKALASRLATLVAEGGAPVASRSAVDAPSAILRAIGRCGGAHAEGALASYVRHDAGDALAESAAYALGAVGARHVLTDETIGALVDRASADPGSAASAAALFPLGRQERVPEPWTVRVLTAARAVLAKQSPLRGFALAALEKAGEGGALDLSHAVTDVALPAADRADAARALARMGHEGAARAASALVHLLADHATLEPDALLGDGFNVLLPLVAALETDPPKTADAALVTLSSLPVAKGDAAPLRRRVALLRCAAALALARAAFDADTLVKCDPDPEGAVGQRARLTALLRRPLVGERKKAFHSLASSAHVTVKEAALEAIGQHPELDDLGRALLVAGLSAAEPGVVATAAEAVVQHPERVLTLAASEKRAALDPRAPPPTSHPAMDLPKEVGGALRAAIERPWKDDAVETRAALLDAAVAVNLPDVHALATRACADVNVTMREHAVRALRSLGAPQASCPVPPRRDGGAPPPLLGRDTRVRFDVAGKKLGVVFEAELTPIAAARFVALAKAGFYRGIVVHRVVPGYVVQLGDPGGDGYGGSGESLRCETSPVPFGALDVGVALAGRDTGSSQLFVTLARYPKLDGDYARVGRAEGDWDAVAEGDVVGEVSVEE